MAIYQNFFLEDTSFMFNCYQSILPVLSPAQAILITAPPGWGKTYKLLDAIKGSSSKVVAIFPLRALCDEVYISALKLGISCINLKSGPELQVNYSQLIISTPECLSETIVDSLNSDTIFVFDEFHLFYYWGESFRQKLLECLYLVGSKSFSLLLLSATFSSALEDKFKADFQINYERLDHINFGNQELKNMPKVVNFYPLRRKEWMLMNMYHSRFRGTNLVFCEYRQEVKELEKVLTSRGFTCISCVGGEASDFVEKLQQGGSFDFIIATSVVSHGVNLPQISEIYFTYKISNIDFYIQMIGRGGRDGSSFNIHTFELGYFSKVTLFKGFFGNILNSLGNWVKSLLYYANEC